MSGVVDVGFWIMYLIIGLPMFCAGYVARSWVQAERVRRSVERSRARHPSTQAKHWRVVD